MQQSDGRCQVSLVKDTQADYLNLGRGSSMLLGRGGKVTRLIQIYISHNPSQNSVGFTVGDQQQRFFESQGDFQSVRDIYFDQFIAQLLLWKAAGEEIVMMGDFNEDVYLDRFATRFAESDLNLSEQCLATNKQHIPPTFINGSHPIDAVFVTSGIDCINACILPKYGGVGDHRVFIMDFCATSVIGESFPNIVTPSSRKLHCNSMRLVNN